MRRFAAVSGRTVGSEKLWMGQTHVASSSDHHHGESETALHVQSGHPEFVFVDGHGDQAEEVCLRTSPATTSSCRRTCRTARRTPTPPRRRWS
ncbi:hypothetical protein ACFQVA_01795 [Actinomadura keratinilytica]